MEIKRSISYKMRLMTCAFSILITFKLTSASCDDITEAFTSYLVTPYVIPVVPPQTLSVRYSTEIVRLGNKIPAYAASSPPFISYEGLPDHLYTIAIVDPDIPSAAAPKDGQYLHALLVNIQGNNLTNCDYLTSYSAATPYPGSGYHRYVILLYKQAMRLDVTSRYLRSLPNNLVKFSITAFANRYSLGNPIAGNFFRSQLTVCDEK